MAGSTTMTIRVSDTVKERLGHLARDTRRSRSYLAAEAVAAYVDRELAVIDGIQRGIADVEAVRVVAHADALAELEVAVEGSGRV